jgi:hypothetical protein
MAYFPRFKNANGLRDFALLKKCIPIGSQVYIPMHGKNHHATFHGNKFMNNNGDVFKSPFAFSTYVTRIYSDTAGPPNGWDAIYIKTNEFPGQMITIGDLYNYKLRS